MARKAVRKVTRAKVGVSDEVQSPEKTLKPSQCRNFMRKRLAEEFPHIVHGFVREAKSGSCAHVKLANELLLERAEKKRTPRRMSSAEQILKELEKL